MYCTKCGKEMPENGQCQFCAAPIGEKAAYTPGMPLPVAPAQAVEVDPPAVAMLKSFFESKDFFAVCLLQSLCTIISGYSMLEIADGIFSPHISMGFVPMVLVTIGLWIIFSTNKKLAQGQRFPIKGITLCKVGVLIGTISSAVVFLGIGFVSANIPAITKQIGEFDYIDGNEAIRQQLEMVPYVAFEILAVICIVIGALMIVSAVFFAKTFNRISEICVTGRCFKKISSFLIVIFFMAGAANLLLITFSAEGFFVPFCLGLLGFVIGTSLLRLRKRLGEISTY